MNNYYPLFFLLLPTVTMGMHQQDGITNPSQKKLFRAVSATGETIIILQTMVHKKHKILQKFTDTPETIKQLEYEHNIKLIKN